MTKGAERGIGLSLTPRGSELNHRVASPFAHLSVSCGPLCGGGMVRVAVILSQDGLLDLGVWFSQGDPGSDGCREQLPQRNPGDLLELPVLSGLPRPTKSETQKVRSRNLRVDTPSR